MSFKVSKQLPSSKKPTRSIETWIIVWLVIGIIITSVSVWFFRSEIYFKENKFTSLYFDDPSNLPNKVKPHYIYEYHFSVASHTNNTKKFNITYGSQFYKLYDYIESRHHCMSKFREKIFGRWTNDTKGFSVANRERLFEPVEPMVVMPDFSKKITWENYTFEFGFPPPTVIGEINVFFANKSGIIYKINLDEYYNKTYFNGKVISYGLDFHNNNNKLKIVVVGKNITLMDSKGTIFQTTFENTTNGQFGFETIDTYASIQYPKAYVRSPIVIPNDDTIYEYNYDMQKLIRARSEINQMRSKKVRLVREVKRYNDTVDCEKEPFYCKYFDLPNDISFYIDGVNLTKVIEKVPVVGSKAYFKIYPKTTKKAQINWSSYNLEFLHTQLPAGSKGVFILKFEEKWAIMITRNNSYFLRPVGKQIVIDEIRNPAKRNISVEKVLVNVTKDNITLFIDDKKVFARQSPKDYTNGFLEAYSKSGFPLVTQIDFNKNDARCNNRYYFGYCSLTLDIRVSRSKRYSTDRQVFQIGYGYYANQKNKITSIPVFNISSYEQANMTTSTGVVIRPEVKAPDLNIPIYNEFIPDKNIKFNDASFIAKNETDFKVSFSYKNLDGAKVNYAGFVNPLTLDYIFMHVLERQKKIVISYFKDSKLKTINVSYPINTSHINTISVTNTNKSTTFWLDRKLVYELKDTGFDSGMFFIGSVNTYSVFSHIKIRIGNRTRSVVLSEADACDFRLIDEDLVTEEITLKPYETKSFERYLKVMSGFDFGKVSVRFDGKEIHYWVMRDDS